MSNTKILQFFFTSSYSLNIQKAYVLKALSCSWVIIATLLLFYKSKGLTFQDLFILKAALSATVFITELPSGYFADVMGRKKSIILSYFLCCISLLSFCLGSSFYLFLFAEVVFGLGLSLLSGADTALVFDSLKAKKEEYKFQKIEGKLGGIGGYSEAIGGIVGGFVASYNLVYPFYLQLFLIFIALIISLSLKEPERLEIGLNEENRFKELFIVFKSSIFINKELSKLILVGALLSCSTFFIVWHTQAYLEFINLDILYFGYFWAFFHVILGISSNFSNYFSSFFTNYKAYLVCAFTLLFSYIFLSLSTGLLGVLFITTAYIVRGLRMPIHNSHLHSIADSSIRASVFSVQSLVFRFTFILLSPFIGYVADYISLQLAFALTGVILCVPATFIILFIKANN